MTELKNDRYLRALLRQPVINTAMATYPQMRLSGRPYHCLLLTDMLTSISECR